MPQNWAIEEIFRKNNFCTDFLHAKFIRALNNISGLSLPQSFQFFLQVYFSEFLLKELLRAVAFALSLLARCAAYQSALNDMDIQKICHLGGDMPSTFGRNTQKTDFPAFWPY